MLAPIAWLRDYVDLPDDPHAIADALSLAGFPTHIAVTPPVITGVVVGTIVNIEKHPNADRLQVCTIDVGATEMLTIATAATNVGVGQVVPVAKIGAQLPEMTIAPRTMRGIASEGMLCSAGELGLVAEWFEDGIMQLDSDARNGADVVALFGLADPILEVEVTTNRVDALSMVGLARELSARFGTELRFPETYVTYGGARVEDGVVVTRSFDSLDLRVTLESTDCRRFVAQRVSYVDVRPAKAWMQVRLALAGQRPINNLVDISNFVMLELGQPLHFYDYDKIEEQHIIVRDARDGEPIVTLDGEERTLTPTALVIADKNGPTGLAGLKGGQVSEVSATTRELVIESACWVGSRIRRMGTALGMRTEASSRNEKNLPIGLCDIGAARAARFLEIEGGAVHMPRGFGRTMGFPTIVDITKSDISRILGFSVTDRELMDSLGKLGFGVDTMLTPELIEILDLDPKDIENVKSFEVRVPYWRSDVSIAADVVEEIARVIGYDRVGLEVPAVAPHAVSSAPFDRERTIAHTLAALGYRELVTLALEPIGVTERFRTAGIDVPALVEIRNPLSDDQRYLRFSLLPAHLAWLAPRRALADARAFEIAHVFALGPDGMPVETALVQWMRSASAIAAPNGGTEPGYLTIAADALAFVRTVLGRSATIARGTVPGLHPGKTGAIVVDGIEIGYVGAIDPRLTHAYEIERPTYAAFVFIDRLPASTMPLFTQTSKYPAIERDLAVVLDPTINAADVAAAARAAGDDAIQNVSVFDEYRGAQISSDKKSLALRITLQRFDATMTDAQADAAIAAIVATLRERFGATIRE